MTTLKDMMIQDPSEPHSRAREDHFSSLPNSIIHRGRGIITSRAQSLYEKVKRIVDQEYERMIKGESDEVSRVRIRKGLPNSEMSPVLPCLS